MKNTLQKIFSKRENVYLAIALAIITLWVLPYFILGELAHMRVQDNLDSNIAWYKVLIRSGQMYGPLDAKISQVLNGQLSRNSYYPEFYAVVQLFRIFPPVIAYGLTDAITRFAAFLGMLLLLKRYVIKEADEGFIRVATALTFALISFWTNGMLSIMGMPLALWAFLNIRNREHIRTSLITITLLPFFSTFKLGFFFFLSALGLFWLFNMIRTRKVQLRLFFSIFYMTAIYLFIEYRQLSSLVFSGEETNRTAFYGSKNTLLRTIRLVFKNYIVGHNQDQTVFPLVILPTAILALIIVIIYRSWRKHKLFIALHILNFMLSVWYAFWWYRGWEPLKQRISILNTFNFSRYHYLRPMVVYVLFALSLSILWQLKGKWRNLVIILGVLQLVVLVPSNEQIIYQNYPSFKQFFAADQFYDIKNFIGKPVRDYRVVSIGLHPAIAQYNGLYTLDTYSNFYPLSYKLRFRKIIAPELDKSKSLRKYYDEWGSRCYIFVSELGKKYMYSKKSTKVINKLSLNIQALKQMGGDYIISAVRINNAEANHLQLKKIFNSKGSYWRIFLYKIAA